LEDGGGVGRRVPTFFRQNFRSFSCENERRASSDFFYFIYLFYFTFLSTVRRFFTLKKIGFPFRAAFQNKQFG
jgi:hypothetical protein